MTPAAQILQVVTIETAGNDTIFGDGGDDIVFGDHGIITQTPDTQRILTTGNVTRVETTNARQRRRRRDSWRRRQRRRCSAAPATTASDGDAGQDLLLGDHATLTGRADGTTTNPRFRTLAGTQLYDAAGNPQMAAAWQTPPGAPPGWANWSITLDDGRQDSSATTTSPAARATT